MIIFEVFDYIVGKIDYFGRPLCFPVCLIVLPFDCEAQVIQEAGQNLFVFPCSSHDAQEVRGHVLTSLVAFAGLKGLFVLDGFVHDGLFEFFDAVVVGDGIFFFIVLNDEGCALVGRRGRPRVLSVLGLMSCPGG